MDRWLAWFGRHSVLWLDTLIRCSGIHNYLSSTAPAFSPFEKLFLANGLRFICTPPSSHYHIYKQHYFDDHTRGWPRFERALLNRLKHGPGSASDEGYIAKFAAKRKRVADNNEFIKEQLREECPTALFMIEEYCRSTRRLLEESTTLDHHRQLIRHQRYNHSSHDVAFVRRLMTDASITIKPADKNLGMCLVDTDWYNTELNRMLSDRVTYRPLNSFTTISVQRSITVLALPRLQQELFGKLKSIVEKNSAALQMWNPQLSDQVQHYLTHSITATTCKVPAIYLLIKVHKASGLCGRPIVPSTNWLTTPASVVADHLLQEIFRQANISHIVKDTKSFVNELELMAVPTQEGIMLTADIATLYTNIDTKLGLTLVNKFLKERGVPTRHADLIMNLLEFVMRNSYLTFRDKIFHQIDGTAMGTACAPTYANIVVYMLEKQLIADMSKRGLYLYRRFLDDIFAYICPTVADELIHRMNTLEPKLKFEFVRHPTEASFLDLRIHKGLRFRSTNVFDLSVHQKKMNLYLYIPFRSFHTDAMKRSFIQTELMRYIRNSSDRADYSQLKRIFYQRLRDRGYPSSFLLPIFENIHYADRHLFLWPSARLQSHPLIHSARSLCLKRRIQRWEAQHRAATVAPDESRPMVFVVPYSPLSRLVATRQLLNSQWGQVQDALNEPTLPAPIIAYQSALSLVKTLVFSRARVLEEARKAELLLTGPLGSASDPSAAKQSSLRNWITRPRG